jgi:hypothetical protein
MKSLEGKLALLQDGVELSEEELAELKALYTRLDALLKSEPQSTQATSEPQADPDELIQSFKSLREFATNRLY